MESAEPLWLGPFAQWRSCLKNDQACAGEFAREEIGKLCLAVMRLAQHGSRKAISNLFIGGNREGLFKRRVEMYLK